MRLIEAPAEWTAEQTSLFLGGGISGCPDWQARMIELLSGVDLVLLNPRRENYPWNDPAAAHEQIVWEHRHLRRATALLFWFPGETLCPITLYELGAWSMTSKPLFVGTHPDYSRRLDIVIQTGLVRPGVPVVSTLEELAGQVCRWVPRAA
jgi:hypothetical protein